MESRETALITDLREHFCSLEDPRSPRGCLHLFIDIIGISLLAVICGAEGFTEIEEFAYSKEAFLRKNFELPNGIPSHDTFGRVLGLLDSSCFEEYFSHWFTRICNSYDDVISIDGKQIRHSYETKSATQPIWLVSAWSNAYDLVLAQHKVSEKSNEITAIPELLKVLDIEGALITIDAMGTQKAIASQIIGKEADYLLALKGNQGNLYQEVSEAFGVFTAKSSSLFDEQKDVGHGRLETRSCWVAKASDWLLADRVSEWRELKSIICIESHIYYKDGKKKGTHHRETRYYISSLIPDAQRVNDSVRKHWGVETKLHWVLDVAFREDDSCVRKGNAPENLSILRRIALNKLKAEKSVKRGIKVKRKKAGWDEDYLIKVLLA
ncbi:ISAs1 family transposase [uncultured Microscilla sp.]|uniref:ISAs1 family transposase n=1 Tax=uncultured Microscilla sp. TaxID=432653 RepID=UPI00261A93A3|nr:ISAs1 family transposase [uncultured Microscilla sp.]